MTAKLCALLECVPALSHDERRALIDALQQAGDLEKVRSVIEAGQELQFHLVTSKAEVAVSVQLMFLAIQSNRKVVTILGW